MAARPSSGGRACRRTGAFSISSPRTWRSWSAASARPIALASASISRTCERSSAGFSGPSSRRSRRLRCPTAPVGVPESYDEHVGLLLRSAGARLRDRPHPRVHVHDGARTEPADVSAHQRDAAPSHAVAPRQQSRSHCGARARQHVSRAVVREVPGTAADRRRTATGRCSTTR